MAKTRAVIENGHTVFAGTGAVNQHGGSLQIMWCNACHEQVAWCTSQRTGRFYLVNIRHKYNGARYYMGHDIHKCAKSDTAATV
ncbi:hypothetical protein LCGC14_2263450 [marine sediment metagenome]|uniref:Uncharacterized protein n=1 Tax=marine sediment metagenome TaxID=412755 RepID=A0A0F9CZ15_9ZZZZ